MKKIISLILISVVLFVTGCGNKEDFYLNYNNETLRLNNEFSKEEYGNYNDYFESENFSFWDSDITYFYDDIEVEAYGDNNKLIVYSILFISDNIKTNEGIGLYDTISDAINVYGNDYVKDGNRYVYNRNNTSIIMIVQNDIIESIEYRIKDMI